MNGVIKMKFLLLLLQLHKLKTQDDKLRIQILLPYMYIVHALNYLFPAKKLLAWKLNSRHFLRDLVLLQIQVFIHFPITKHNWY